MRQRQVIVLGIVAFALNAPGNAYAQGSERAAADGLALIAVIAGAVSLVIGTGIWIAAARYRVRSWLALICTVVAYFLFGAKRQAAPGWFFFGWCATTWCFAAAIIWIRALRKRGSSMATLPTARVVRKGTER